MNKLKKAISKIFCLNNRFYSFQIKHKHFHHLQLKIYWEILIITRMNFKKKIYTIKKIRKIWIMSKICNKKRNKSQCFKENLNQFKTLSMKLWIKKMKIYYFSKRQLFWNRTLTILWYSIKKWTVRGNKWKMI